MKVKLVLHLGQEDEERLREALGNIHNLMEADDVTEATVRVVVNGSAVRLFRKERAGHTADRIRALSEADVSFLICRNSLKYLGIEESELLQPCQVIPAGIVELCSLQASGFAYAKP